MDMNDCSLTWPHLKRKSADASEGLAAGGGRGGALAALTGQVRQFLARHGAGGQEARHMRVDGAQVNERAHNTPPQHLRCLHAWRSTRLSDNGQI